jgi:MoxR-like ATPase
VHPCIAPAAVLAWQRRVDAVYVAPALLDYLQLLLAASRSSAHWETGLSPRAGLALLRAARAWALIDGRGQVVPEDVQAVFPSVAGHRLNVIDGNGAEALAELIAGVDVP